MNDEPGPAHSPTLPCHQPKVVATGQSCGRGEHALRRRGACGPCCGEQRESPVLHGCACAAGTRGSATGGGCSAGKYACSRWISRYWLAKSLSPPTLGVPDTTPGYRRTARRTHPTPRGRPYKATHPRSAGSIRVSVHRPAEGRSATRRTREMLASEHILWHSAALVSVRALGWPDGSGSPTAPRKLCRTSGGFRCGSSYLRAQLWTTLWMLPVVGARPSSPEVGGSGWVGGLDMTEGRRGEGSS
jgi:hypothetical protein